MPSVRLSILYPKGAGFLAYISVGCSEDPNQVNQNIVFRFLLSDYTSRGSRELSAYCNDLGGVLRISQARVGGASARYGTPKWSRNGVWYAIRIGDNQDDGSGRTPSLGADPQIFQPSRPAGAYSTI